MVTLAWGKIAGSCGTRKDRLKLSSLLIHERGGSRASGTSAWCRCRLRAGHSPDRAVCERVLGRPQGDGRFADEIGVADGGCPQGQALRVPFPERIPLRIRHAFAAHHVHADASGTDFLVSGGWVRRINRYRWFRYDGWRVGWRVRHRPPEPQPRPDPSTRTAPPVPHTGVEFGCLAARRPCGDDRSSDDARTGLTCEGGVAALLGPRTCSTRREVPTSRSRDRRRADRKVPG